MLSIGFLCVFMDKGTDDVLIVVSNHYIGIQALSVIPKRYEFRVLRKLAEQLLDAHVGGRSGHRAAGVGAGATN